MPGVVNLAGPDGEMPISRALQAYPDRLFPRTTGNVLRESFYWRAARFNGRDGCVHIPNKPAIQSNTLSIECWFRSTQPFNHRFWPGSATLISTATSGPGSSDWVITAASQRNQDEGRLLAETGPQGKPSDLYLQSKENDPLNDGFWHHVVLTRSAEGLACLYVDGARHATGSDGGGKVIADRAINIGGEVIHPGGTFLNGDMDEVALYTHVLSAERVRAHYEAIRPHLGERPTKVKPPSSKPAAQEPAPAKPILWAEPAPLKPSIANAAKNHWAFQPLQESRVPDVQPRAWIHNDIDAFILATLKAEGLTPARPGDSLTFLRRANFDLLGLPPSPAEINTFADHPDVDQLIDRLLASPHYGERYGRHWLDVVRFADSAGYEIDYYYHHAAPYRDYVIASFNQDKPFDLFIREQLAADEVAADDPALRYATGLLTIGPWKFATGVDRRAASEYERLTDVADTVGTAFLGLTVGCARCHDHKSDPISQHDYFGLHAMIAPASLWDTSTNENAYNKNEKEKNWVVQVPDESPLIRLFTRGQFSNEGPAVRPTLFASISGPATSGRLVESDDQAYRKRRSRLADWLVSENNPLAVKPSHFPAKAKRIIWLFMHGGPSQVDTFDPKPLLKKYDGQAPPEEFHQLQLQFTEVHKQKLMASKMDFVRCGASGLPMSDRFVHFRNCADDIAVVRSCHHNNFNHTPGIFLMNTGHDRMGYPSMGSWLNYGLGSETDNLPAYVVMNDGPLKPGPGVWGNGFLPAVYQGTKINRNGNAIPHLQAHKEMRGADQRAILDQAQWLNRNHLAQRPGDSDLEARIASYELAYRMQMTAPDAVDIQKESKATRELYGSGFGEMCLTARRLVERGTRMVQIYHGCGGGGWDTHGDNHNRHVKLIQSVDQGCAALLHDLKQRGLLEDTLVIWSGEFGRTPTTEGNNGRDHSPYGLSLWMAGGGVRGGQVIGATDDFGFSAVDTPVDVHDLHATILKLMGLNHEDLTWFHQARAQRLTDVHGHHDIADQLTS
ncbi:MAG: hypothetical protein ACI97B_000960 [Verrucomicrobiales bacterium]|jgi:hypothetical protein